MYVPASFAVDDLEELHSAIEKYSFATLFSAVQGDLVATHLPLLLDRSKGPHGTLLGHVARANHQAEQAENQSVLAIFSGPHAYISPTWYEASPAVPTWNYVAVHAYGKLKVVTSKSELTAMLDRMVTLYESGLPSPWKLDSQSEYFDRLLPQIVGFQIQIERLEGKWKLSQNHSPGRQEKVAAALQAQPDENSQAIASLMRKSLLNQPK